MFGKKEEANRVLQSQSNLGCLNNLSDRVGRFFDGDISEGEWSETFDCVEDQIRFFKRYVRGNHPEGYSRTDVAALIRNFLITNQDVSDAFINSMFELKASFVGGKPDVITSKELDVVIELSAFLKRESLIVLPAIRAKRHDPQPETLEKLADTIAVFGDRLAIHMSTVGGTYSVRKESFLPFARELLRLTRGDPAIIDKYGDFGRHVKVLVAGGTSDFIEGQSWPALIREGAAFGGLALAYRDRGLIEFRDPNGDGEFYVSLVRKGTEFADRVLNGHGGSFPVDLLNPIIDTLPSDSLDTAQRSAIKTDLPKILYGMLGGRTMGKLDSGSIKKAYDFFARGMRGQTLVESIYQNLPDSVSLREFEAELMRFEERAPTPEMKNEYRALLAVAKDFIGLYPQGSSVLQISKDMRGVRTKNHMVRMQWFRKAIEFVFSAYATGPNGAGQVQDLDRLTKDFYSVLKEWKLAHPALTTVEMAEKRFREANLFMPNSDGDKLISQLEATYYVSFLFSASSLSGTIFDDIVHDRKLCPIVGVDEIGEPAMEAKCFREQYFGNFETYWAAFPVLQRDYRKMNARNRRATEKAMEIAARRNGFSEDLIGQYDINSFAALPHYAEDVMERFDTNRDTILSKKEIIEKRPVGQDPAAYYVFRETLKTLSGYTQDWILQAALTYAIKYGKLPKSRGEQAHFLAWVAMRPFWQVRGDRAAIYQVLAILAEPIDVNVNIR